MLTRVTPVALVAALSLLGVVGCGSAASQKESAPADDRAPSNDPRACADCQPNDGSSARAESAAGHCSDPAQALESVATEADVAKLLAGSWISCARPRPNEGTTFARLGVAFGADGSWWLLDYNLIGDVGRYGVEGRWTATTKDGKVTLRLEMPYEEPAIVEVSFELHGARLKTVELPSGNETSFAPML